MRTGKQFFPIDYNLLESSNTKNKIKAIKIIIKNTYGGDKTYLNQIMLYENLFEDITLNESGYGINTIPHDEKILPKDFSSSQISNINDSQKTINPTSKTNINEINKFIKNNNNKKMKFKSIGDFVSDDNNSQKSDDISFDEKYKSRSKIDSDKKEYSNDEKDDNEIISTSNDMKIAYNTNYTFKAENINNKKMINNNKNSNNIEKLLKQNILEKKIENINNSNNNIKENKRLNEYKQILNKFSGDNDYYDNNNDEEDNRNNKYLTNTYSTMKYNNKFGIRSNRNSYMDKNNKTFYNDKVDNINNINMKFNAFTPNRFNSTGYDFLMNKKRAFTPNSHSINIVNTPIVNKIKREEKENKNKDPAYEVLQNQLKDMEKHIKYMTINNEIQINPNFKKYNNDNNNISNYSNFLMEEKQQIKRTSMKSNNSFNSDNNINKNRFIKNNNNGYYSEINDNMSNYNNINYSNNINNNINNSNTNNNIYSLQDLNTNGKMDINRRIENLEKCVFDIKDELNNLSDKLRVLFNRDEFMYNFKDAIKQVCFEFLNEKLNSRPFNNNNNNEEYNNFNEGEEENEGGQYYNQNNNSQYSENIDENNYNNYNNYNNQNYQNNNTMNNTANKFEIEINKKIDEKLNYLSENIKNQIYEKFLQPSISEIEQTMKQNIDEIKGKVDAINNNTTTNSNNNIIKTNKEDNDLDEEDYELQAKYGVDYKDSIYYKTSSKMRKEKYEEINRLGEKLYDKLLEKEKKLKLLKKETSLLMNEGSSKNDIFDNSQNY